MQAPVIPGFKKGAAGVGVGFGRGFIFVAGKTAAGRLPLLSRRNRKSRRTIGREEIDIVVSRSIRHAAQAPLRAIHSGLGRLRRMGETVRERMTIPMPRLFFTAAPKEFRRFGLDGATLKRDQAGYKPSTETIGTNADIVDGGTSDSRDCPALRHEDCTIGKSDSFGGSF